MSDFKPRDPDYRAVVQQTFDDAPFIRSLGAVLDEVGPGSCVTSLELTPNHLQQDGVVHAGVQATLADHTAGCSAATLMAPGERVFTIEFKINLLRAGHGEGLVCRARVLRPGATITVAEAEVFVVRQGEERLTAKATLTFTFKQGIG